MSYQLRWLFCVLFFTNLFCAHDITGDELVKASMFNDMATMRYYIEQGVDLNQCNDEDISPLMLATYYGYFDMVVLLHRAGADINQENHNGYTALLYAVFCNHKRIIEFLVEHGADINHANRTGWTALMYASMLDDKGNMAHYLIEHGADICAKTDQGLTVVDIARAHNHEKLAKYFIESGAFDCC